MVHLPVTCCKLKYFHILDSVSVDSCSNHSGCPVAEFKVLLIGEHGVGKTALLLRHLTGEFFQGGEAAKSRLATWQRKWKGIKLSTFFCFFFDCPLRSKSLFDVWMDFTYRKKLVVTS